MNTKYYEETRMKPGEVRTFNKRIRQHAFELVNTFGSKISGQVQSKMLSTRYILKNLWRERVGILKESDTNMAWGNPEWGSDDLFMDKGMRLVFNREERRAASYKIYYFKKLLREIHHIIQQSTSEGKVYFTDVVRESTPEEPKIIESVDEIRIEGLLPEFNDGYGDENTWDGYAL